NKLNGDWAGYAQEIIEREQPGVVAMVAIGCGADANPSPRGDDLVYPQQHGDAIAREVKRLLGTPFTPLSGKLVAQSKQIELPFDTLPTHEEWTERAAKTGPIAYHAKVNLARLDRGEKLPTTLPYDIKTWTF